MQLGMIGLGRMGASMVRRLMKGGHTCVVHDREPSVMASLVAEGATGAASMNDMVLRLKQPRVVWLMLPVTAVDPMIAQLMQVLDAGDVIVDGGNSHYPDDIRRGVELKTRGIHYVDVGTSGGVAGLARGYCLIVGGEADSFEHLRPIFSTLAPGIASATRTLGAASSTSGVEEGFLHCGSHGAGHFVKMVHNGIEYGMMAAYAEGFNILRNAGVGKHDHAHVLKGDAETTPLSEPDRYQFELNLPEIAEVWRRGSVIGSWLLDLTAAALMKDPVLKRYAGRVADGGDSLKRTPWIW